MGNIRSSVEQLIGNTPLLELSRLAAAYGAKARLLAKLEYLNPAGSAKDRVALSMIRDAEKKGLLSPGATIIEPTSGNTGLGLAAVAAARGYRVVIVMPDSMSVERQLLMRAYGASLVLTPGIEGMSGAIRRAEELAAATPNSWIPAQFDNPANALAHYRTTGPEIWAQTGEKVDVFVAGVGTGGTLTGTGHYLKEQNPAIRIIAVEPDASPLLSRGDAGSHGIQGIGANFVPTVLDTSLPDAIVRVTDAQAFAEARKLAAEHGILAGISAGANIYAARRIAAEHPHLTVVTVLPDSGTRYLSGSLFK